MSINKNKIIRVKLLSERQADSIEELKFGKKLATGRYFIQYKNDIQEANLEVGYDSLRGMMCAATVIDKETYVSYDQRLIVEMVDDIEESTSIYQEKIYKDGKIIKPYKDFDVLKDGGKIAGHLTDANLDNASDGAIYLTRDGKQINDDSINYIYTELQKINGQYGKEEVSKSDVNMILRSASIKATECLLPVMGDSIANIIRRDITLDTFITWCVANGGDNFIEYLANFRDDVLEQIEANKDTLTPAMQKVYTSKKEPSYKQRTLLSTMIREEKEFLKQEVEEGNDAPTPVNFIDLMFITELIDNLNNDKDDDYSAQLYNSYVFDTDRIVAGARTIACIATTLTEDLKYDDGDIGPAISENSGINEEAVVGEFLEWLEDEHDVDNLDAIYNEYFFEGKTPGEIFKESLKSNKDKSTLEEAFGGKSGKKGKSKLFETKNDKSEFSSALSKLGSNKNKNKKFNTKNEEEKDMRILSKTKASKKEDIREYTMDGETFYVDFNDVRETSDGDEIVVIYNSDEEIVGGMYENGKAIDTDEEYVGRMKEKSKSTFGSKSSSRFGSKSKSSFGSSKSKFGSKSKSSFGSSKSKFGRKDEDEYVECMIGDNDTIYYVTTNEVDTDEGIALEIIDKREKVVAAVLETGEVMDTDGEYVGDIVLEEEEDERPKFGSKSKSSFGSSKSKFGSKSSSSFGKKTKSAFGSSLKDNPAASLRKQFKLV